MSFQTHARMFFRIYVAVFDPNTLMKVALSVWYDESKGLINGKRPEDLIEIDPDSDEEAPADALRTPANNQSDPPTRPPSSASERSNNDEELDIDSMIREDEERQRQQTSSAPAPAPTGAGGDEFDDEFDVSMWEDFAFGDDPIPGPSKPVSKPPANQDQDQDQDMWDIVAELETETSSAAVSGKPIQTETETPTAAAGQKPMETDTETQAATADGKPMETDADPPANKPAATSSYLDDWDDMYA